MKTMSLLGLLAIVGGVGGAGYAEFDRITTNDRTAKEHVFQLTRAYIKDRDIAAAAASSAVKKCVSELHFIEFPPVLTSFLTDNAIVEYEIVRKYGSKAHQQKHEVEDMRNALSAEYYDLIDEELDELDPQHLKRTLQVMREYNGNRKEMSRCIHKNAYQALRAQGALES